MSRKAKKQAKAQAAATPVVKPFSVTLKPLQIVQPVSICQSFNSVSSAWEEPAAPVETKKKKRRGRKFFRFLLVLVLLAVAYAVAAYLVPTLPLHNEIAGLIK